MYENLNSVFEYKKHWQKLTVCPEGHRQRLERELRNPVNILQGAAVLPTSIIRQKSLQHVACLVQEMQRRIGDGMTKP